MSWMIWVLMTSWLTCLVTSVMIGKEAGKSDHVLSKAFMSEEADNNSVVDGDEWAPAVKRSRQYPSPERLLSDYSKLGSKSDANKGPVQGAHGGARGRQGPHVCGGLAHGCDPQLLVGQR